MKKKKSHQILVWQAENGGTVRQERIMGVGVGAIDVLRIVPLESETKGQFSDGVGSLLD